ncbi:hypothetical protein KFK09_013444 [Dendrobium nobile]|uniref:Uncharacterized protein n=1 Tax=Dendrobium nobile TaxID=94219 RepID=A0A8T3B9M5_DENNO|nr:hypothetical protein KFK09_013444 [Dendrobium nobile]
MVPVQLVGPSCVTPMQLEVEGSVTSSPPVPMHLSGKPFIEVPISLISNDELKIHLKSNLNRSYLEQIDWFGGGGGGGVSFSSGDDEPGADFALQIDHFVVSVSSRGRGKRGRK